MKVAKTADWRDAVPFGTPVLVADVIPGEPTRCSVCGADSEPRSRDELWAFKHQHPHHHDGYVQFYCGEHVPKVEVAPVAAPPAVRSKRAPATRSDRTPAVRRPTPNMDRVRAMCPDCFIEVSAKGVCGNCGRTDL